MTLKDFSHKARYLFLALLKGITLLMFLPFYLFFVLLNCIDDED
jgi:hypothetical protein